MKTDARVIRALDGDTLWIRLRVRLRKNQPELGTPAGERAFDRTQRRFPPGKRLLLRLGVADAYGRLVTDLN